MKQLLATATFLVLALYALGQPVTTPLLSPEDYLAKSKKQKATAWVFLVGGAGMNVLGLMQANHIKNDPSVGFPEGLESSIVWATVATTGGVLAVCSIPLFIASRNNARKAAAIGMSHQKIMVPQGNCFRWRSQPALTLQLTLGR